MSRTGLAEELPELEASLLSDPSPRNVMRVADACRLAGAPDRALELLETLVSERPTAIAPLVLMAWCLDDLGRGEESRARLEDLRAVDPANPWAAGRAIPEVPTDEAPREPAPERGEVIAEESPEELPAEGIAEEPPEEPPAEGIAEEPSEELPAEGILAESREDLPAGGVLEESGEEAPLELSGTAESDVFEIPEESDLTAAVAELSGVLPAPETEAQAEPAEPAQADPTPVDPELTEPELAEAEPAEPEPTDPEPTDPEPAETEPAETEPADPEPAGPLAESPDEEAQAEPERALTAEQLADIPPSPLYSATLAEIFERQGFEEKAMQIYAEVVRTHPERVDLRERIAELERRVPGEPGR